MDDDFDLSCVLFHREQSSRHIVISSADEKLRNLGGHKQHHGSKSSISVVSQHSSLGRSPQQHTTASLDRSQYQAQTKHTTASLGRIPGRNQETQQTKGVVQVPIQTSQSYNRDQQQGSDSTNRQNKGPRFEPPRQPPPDPPKQLSVPLPVRVIVSDNTDDLEMSDRRIQRMGRRDQAPVQQSMSQESIKRRSRSEGPASRLKPRNSMDEKKMLEVKNVGKSTDQYKPRQRTRHSMYTEPFSDDGGFPDIQGSSTSASDSDEAFRKKWVKNPLIVKRVKKTDKRKSLNSTENTGFGKENYNNDTKNVRTSNRVPTKTEIYVSHDRNNGNNNSQKGKYQKLEERRKKRVDITVTSDEELNSPELRISKLRQRALQGTKMATKLPDRLEDVLMQPHTQTGDMKVCLLDVAIFHREREGNMVTKGKLTFISPYIQVVRSDYIETKPPEPMEQGSSSSEQITLRQIGPGQNQDRFRQVESYTQPIVPRNNNMMIQKDSYHGYQQQGRDGKGITVGPGGYKKIPRQDTDFLRQFEVSKNVAPNPSVQRSESYGSANDRYRNQPHQGGVTQYSKAINQFSSNPQEQWTQNRKVNSDTEMNFNQVQTNRPMVLKKAIDRVDRKRRSKSDDDDSLDELIESNIQYLESEIESGKLKKMPSNQPVSFPVYTTDVKQTHYTPQKQKSSSMENFTRPVQNSSFQNEVKLRLQIPSSQPQRKILYTRPNESFDSKPVYTQVSSNQPVTTAPSAARTALYHMYQNTVPSRRHQSATHSPYMQRRSTELADMEDLSKSDSQLNSAEFNSNNYGQHYMYSQPQVHGQNSSQGTVAHYDNVAFSKQPEQQSLKSLSVPALEQGMFSDVEYDIEVSERVKKWEKFMNKKPIPGENPSKDQVSLTTILENEGGIPDSWLRDVSRVPVSDFAPQSRSVSSISVTVTKSHITPAAKPEIKPKPVPPKVVQEPRILPDPRAVSTETSSHRIVRVIKQPNSSPDNKISTSDSSVTYIQAPMKVVPHERTVQSNMMSNYPTNVEESSKSDGQTDVKQHWPPRRNKSLTEEQKLARLSKFEEELCELQELKQDSVKDLRRRFDSEGSGNESTDVADELSSACRTPIRQRKQFTKIVYHVPDAKTLEEKSTRQVYRRNSLTFSDRSNPVSDISSPIPEAEVWSPNLESSKGLVSIERVKARTLQTIPFSEDPIWKQIEEMTTFDQLLQSGNPLEISPSLRPGESVAYIKRNEADDVTCVSYGQNPITTSPGTIYATSITPNSRAFATPVIKPLKLNTTSEKSSVAALDEVLEDIRSSLQRKSSNTSVGQGTLERLSPTKYSPMLSPSMVRPTQQVFSNPPVMTSSSVAVVQKNDMSPVSNVQSFGTNAASLQSQRLTELQNQFNLSQQSIQPTMQPPQQSAAPQAMHIIPDYTQEPYIINGNYQLDPQLLKEKLLSTGLAGDASDIESLHGFGSSRRSTTPTRGLYQPEPPIPLQNQQMVFNTQPIVNPTANPIGNPQPPIQQSQPTVTQRQKQSETEKQVLQTVEDLKNLAKDVEKRLSQIRTKMESSDENKLDSILFALKNFTPAVEPTSTVQQRPTVQLSSEYVTKKNKLQDALSELDRIYGELNLPENPVATVTSEIKGSTVPRQYRSGQDTPQTPKLPVKKRNKSDSDFSEAGTAGITIADLERQTQKEFDDINLAFQTLLSEVEKPIDFEDEKTEVSKKDYQSNADEIEATIESFLQEFEQSKISGNKTTNFNKALEDYNENQKKKNTCTDIKKSEVYTVSSGPFSVVVGVNGKQAPSRNGETSRNNDKNIVRRKRAVPLPWKSNAVQSCGAQTENNDENRSVEIKYPTPRVSVKEKPTEKDFENDECSDSSEQSSGSRQRFARRGKRFNAHHRKSLPAEILKRSVETQTIEEPKSPKLPDEMEKEKVAPKEFERLREDSLSSECSLDGKIPPPQKRKVAKNIAKKIELFSSSEDERDRKSNLRHSLSAPDIRELFDYDKVTTKSSGTSSKIQTPRLVKQRYEARVRRKSSQNNKDKPQDVSKTEEVTWTSATSDDSSQVSQGSKPPLHPGRKKSSSPDRISTDSKSITARKSSSDVESTTDMEVVRRRKKSNSTEEQNERPHSFHELLTMFETNQDRLHRLRNSLRKCASADNIFTEVVMKKSYHSEPDLREGSPAPSGAKLLVEIQVKKSLETSV